MHNVDLFMRRLIACYYTTTNQWEDWFFRLSCVPKHDQEMHSRLLWWLVLSCSDYLHCICTRQSSALVVPWDKANNDECVHRDPTTFAREYAGEQGMCDKVPFCHFDNNSDIQVLACPLVDFFDSQAFPIHPDEPVECESLTRKESPRLDIDHSA